MSINKARTNETVFSFMWQAIKPYKWHYLVMLLAPIGTAFYDFANNYALKLVIDAFTENSLLSWSSFALPIFIFIFANISLDVLWRVADIAEWKSEPFVRQALLNQVFERVSHYPYGFFQNATTGSITSRIKGILDGYDNFWAAMHHDLTPRVAGSIVLTAVLAIVNIKVCIFVGLWGILFVSIMYLFSLKLDKKAMAFADERHKILGSIADSMANIFTVFAFAGRKKESDALNTAIKNNFIPSNIRLYKFSFLTNCVAGVMYWIMLISLFLYMIHLRKSGQASSGDFVFVITTALKMSWELWQVVQKMQSFMKNMGDFKSSYLLMHQAKPTSKGQKPDLMPIHPSIEFSNLNFAYSNENPVFSGFNLKIAPGEKVGLVGLSGSGKSTLVSLLMAYFKPKSGIILVGGQDIAQVNEDSLREQIALIPQDIMLFHRTILENLSYGRPHASYQEVVEAAKLANIHEFIMSLPEQYNSMVGERGIKLSGGQRQRIAIARAILKNAPIVILDEATSSLDSVTESMIQESLDLILAKKQATVIAIAHRLSTIKHLDRIIVLQHGRIIEQGRHDYLVNHSETYRNLWNMQKI